MHLVTVAPGDIPVTENMAAPASFPPRRTDPDWTGVATAVVAVNWARTPLGSQTPSPTTATRSTVSAQRRTLGCAKGRTVGIAPPFLTRVARRRTRPRASPLKKGIG